MNRLEQIAQCMLDQHNLKQNFENLPETLMPKDFDEAYETQKIFPRDVLPFQLKSFVFRIK